MPDYKKYFIIPDSREEVYMALTHPRSIELWTGESAEMTAEAGTEFSMWNGSITGKNLEFEPNKKIIQQWYFGEQEEPSIVTIKLHDIKDGTSLEVRHTNIPAEAYDDICSGWEDTYIASLINFFED